MFRELYLWVRRHLLHFDDRSPLQRAVDNGMKIGIDCHVEGGCSFDAVLCHLIEIGDRVTLAPFTRIYAHDASTKRPLGYARIARVKIGNDVFIGTGTIILPGVTIGSNVIVGAGSVVSRSIPDNSVAVGNPCRVIGTYEDFLARRSAQMKNSPKYGDDYLAGSITEERKNEMLKDLADSKQGYII